VYMQPIIKLSNIWSVSTNKQTAQTEQIGITVADNYVCCAYFDIEQAP